LKHLTEDKLNSRAKGRKEIMTHQPTAGRGNEGGAKIGEMERDVLIAHGVSQFINESYMKRSDGTTIWICNGCGTVPIYNEKQELFICPLCEGGVRFTTELNLIPPITKSRVTFSRVNIPYSYKLLDQELSWQGNISMRIITEKQGRVFRPIVKGEVTAKPLPPPTTLETVTTGAESIVKGITDTVTALVGESPAAPVKPAEPISESSVADEKAIAKANAVLEEPITAAPVESTGPTIIIETGAPPAEAVTVEPVEAAPPAEAAPPVAPAASPAEAAPPVAPAATELPTATPLALLPGVAPKKGGARPRISWGGTTEVADSSPVTLIKLG